MSRKEMPCTDCGAVKYFEGRCWRCKAKNNISDLEALTETQKQDRIQDIIQNITDDAYAYDKFLQLFSICRINTQAVAKAAIENGIFWPAELYTDASPEVRDQLIERLKVTENSQEAGALQCCLAMIGDDIVLKFFHHLEHNPLPWREKLYVDPSKYAEKGGWSFNVKGERYALSFESCYCLTQTAEPDEALQIGRFTSKKCDNCDCALVDMLTLNGRDRRLIFLGIEGEIKITFCPNCVSISNIVFCKYEIDGDCTTLPFQNPEEENYLSDEDLKIMDANTYVLSATPVNPYFGIANEVHNTIGGRANWVQDWEHYTCPSCTQKMKYFAQIHWDTLIESMEGTLFFEICTDCQMVGVFHQQT